MNKKWLYFLALLCLPLLRVAVFNSNCDEWLESRHYDRAAHLILALRDNGIFEKFIGNWALPPSVLGLIIYWMLAEDNQDIPVQFFLVPLMYVPISIIGETLMHAEFKPEYLYVHPLIILPFGYLYVSVWATAIWLLSKLRLVE